MHIMAWARTQQNLQISIPFLNHVHSSSIILFYVRSFVVVVAPNQDRWREAFWRDILKCLHYQSSGESEENDDGEIGRISITSAWARVCSKSLFIIIAKLGVECEYLVRQLRPPVHRMNGKERRRANDEWGALLPGNHSSPMSVSSWANFDDDFYKCLPLFHCSVSVYPHGCCSSRARSPKSRTGNFFFFFPVTSSLIFVSVDATVLLN